MLDLIKQKEVYPDEYMSDFEKIKEKLSSKENIYNSLTSRRNTNEEYEHVLKI